MYHSFHTIRTLAIASLAIAMVPIASAAVIASTFDHNTGQYLFDDGNYIGVQHKLAIPFSYPSDITLTEVDVAVVNLGTLTDELEIDITDSALPLSSGGPSHPGSNILATWSSTSVPYFQCCSFISESASLALTGGVTYWLQLRVKNSSNFIGAWYWNNFVPPVTGVRADYAGGGIWFTYQNQVAPAYELIGN